MFRAFTLALLIQSAVIAAEPTTFEVSYTPAISRDPISARVYVMLGPAQSFREPRFGPDWFNTKPFFAVDAKNWKPGEPLKFGADSLGFPGPLESLKPGDYAAQAVVRLNPDTHSLGDGEGNAYSPVVKFHIGAEQGGVTALEIDRLVQSRPLRESENVKLVDIPSPLLSKFHRRPIRHRAAVVLPAGDPSIPRPALYIIPGFGTDHHMSSMILRHSSFTYGKDLIRVVLNPDCGTGHHVFADSAANGPRGKALVEELIPHIEKTFNAIPEAGARLLNGHSSGGWSSLWLQVAYPDYFGGTWSTAPDPVDFRAFLLVNLYAQNENIFRDEQGKPRPVSRPERSGVLLAESFYKMEEVLGAGGQMHSFESVFSPLGIDGKPRPICDRKTGAIDQEVAKAWQAYDIRLILERNWASLGPKLRGKLHVIVGSQDTFYLEGAVRLLKESQQTLGSDATIEIVAGKDHGSLLTPELATRFDREMNETVAKYLNR